MKNYLLLLSLFFTTLASSQETIELKLIESYCNRSPEIKLWTSARELKTKHYGVAPKKIIKALDQDGNPLKYKPLKKIEMDDYGLFIDLYFERLEGTPDPKSISEVEVIIESFIPTVENKGIINIEDPLDRYQTNLLKEFNNENLCLYLLDPVGLLMLKNKKPKEYQKTLSDLESEGYGNKENFENIIKYLSHDALTVDEDAPAIVKSMVDDIDHSSTLHFYKKDTKNLIYNIYVYDKMGNDITYVWKGGNALTIGVSKKLQEIGKIEIILRNENTFKDYKGYIKNIKLDCQPIIKRPKNHGHYNHSRHIKNSSHGH